MVLKRNLPSNLSARLNPWEEANKPATHQPGAALRLGQDDPARKPTQAARQPGQGQTMQTRLPQSLIGGGEPAQTRQQREPRNLLEAVQAAGRRRGLLPPEPEQEFDFPAIKRATGTLTSIFGRAPREGDIIPAGSVDRYLKSLSADQFDKREDIEFFNHVRDAYRQAYPTTSYDISGRMSDSPPVAIPFMPWGEAKPRSPQGMGAGTGMPGIIKASAPAEELHRFAQPRQQAQPELQTGQQVDSGAREAETVRGQQESQVAQAPNAPKRSAGPAHTSPASASSTLPRLDDIDLAFIHERENSDRGKARNMDVPLDDAGHVIGDSGPTIGAGVDLGQRNKGDLANLVKYGLSAGLAKKLEPYLGKKGPAALSFIRNNPLTLSDTEMDELTDAAYRQIRDTLEHKFDATMQAKGSSVRFQTLDPAMRTVAMSVAVQYGGNLDKATPAFWRHLVDQNATAMHGELVNFKDSHSTRRKLEAAYLQKNWKGHATP